jgi:sec-independent protein translocase protein TatA
MLDKTRGGRTEAMPNLGGWEFVILIGVLVLLFGAKRLPDMARSIGQSARVFKGEMKGMKGDDKPADKPAEPPAAAAAPPAELPPAAPVAQPVSQPVAQPSAQPSATQEPTGAAGQGPAGSAK